MELTHTKNGNALVVAVKGRMDAVTAPDFENGFAELMQDGEKLYVVDLTNLEYISSAGLRSVLSIAKKIKAAQAEIRFFGLQGMVKEVFAISGFSAMFPIKNSLEEATAE